jgi:hypothetical protein
MRFKVVCINNKNKPVEIPAMFWLEKDEMYTVVSVQKMAKQPGKFGFVLAELPLPENCPYDSFLSERFRLATEDDFEAMEAVKALLEEVEEGMFVNL